MVESKELDGATILAVPMDPDRNGAHATTVRGYLCRLLSTLWFEEDAFSGKRPFGNSGWQVDVYEALAKAGLLEATYDADGCLEDFSYVEANGLVQDAITALGADR